MGPVGTVGARTGALVPAVRDAGDDVRGTRPGTLPWSVPVDVLAWPDDEVALEVVVADTPVGEVVLLVTSSARARHTGDGTGDVAALAGLAMVRASREEALAGLVDDLSQHADVRAHLVPGAPAALEGAARPLAGALAALADSQGRVRVLVSGTPFARAVMTELVDVPHGATITYGELARRAGAPRAARAVGTVMARTLVPLVVPCHRVVPASGGIGAYGPHPRLKRTLLELEGALS